MRADGLDGGVIRFQFAPSQSQVSSVREKRGVLAGGFDEAAGLAVAAPLHGTTSRTRSAAVASLILNARYAAAG